MKRVDHVFDIPLDHADGPPVRVFARELTVDADRPWLLFLQGGPGFGAPRPLACSGWIRRALDAYRVLLLDARGTGLSDPVNRQWLADCADPVATLAHYRADAIVRDAEWIRRALLGEQGRWTVLGQSFGGFCAVHYLSAAPEALTGVLITGGLPPIGVPIDDVYRATYRRVRARNAAYYARFPQDAERVCQLAGRLAEPRMLQQLGLVLGAHDGLDRIHHIVEHGVAGRGSSDLFLHQLVHELPFGRNPLFSLLHEPIYCEGYASRWSAARVLAEYPEFELGHPQPLHFTGEMIYPWIFEHYASLRPFEAVAHALAEKDDWPALYDRARLAASTVPAVALIYAEDMYVERAFSEASAAMIGRLQVWLTNEFQHDGLRSQGERILDGLLARLREIGP